MSMEAVALRKTTVRPLRGEDLDAVVAIDAASEGHTRRAYFERRLDAAMREPKLHAQFAAVDDQGLVGYILARVLEGEFGRSAPGLRLEVVGVRADAKGRGVGASLFDALCDYGRRHGLADVRTQTRWNEHRMVRWIDEMGFTLAPNHVLDCAVAGGEYRPARDDPKPADAGTLQEIDYGIAQANDFEHLARDTADVRAMEDRDLAEIVRIDRRLTGRDRTDYMRHKLGEAMHGSAIRVSLTARLDGAIVGFVMARADLGDFGRTEPVAVIDTIGVDPGYAHRGVGHALLSQLFANLGALRIERVETVVAPRDFGLVGFLYDVGFAPSQRLPFVRRFD
ncbi:MAG: GNAT family N-acetyltransferase [Burkholderiales bacterium]|nr:GNAT family N-acetyltransferase [Burkholderiales bacterium]